MNDETDDPTPRHELFDSAEWYDRAINWTARLERELPVLSDVLGPPEKGGVIDAGCGSARQTCAMGRRGYRMVAADLSEEMLLLGRRRAEESGQAIEFVQTSYAELFERLGGGFDGLYCIGNALAAAGTRDGVRDSLQQFARCLRPGGRLFVQVLNFPAMRNESPCIRGPRVVTVEDVEYISVRQFHFAGDQVEVTNVTLWRDGGWRRWAKTGRLYPVELAELRAWCEESGLHIDAEWSSYDRAPFDIEKPTDLIITATRG